MIHSTTACHTEGWQPGGGLSRDMKFLYLAILLWAIPCSLWPKSVSSFFLCLSETDFRDISGGWKRAVAEAGTTDMLHETISCGHWVRGSLYPARWVEGLKTDHLVTTALLGFPAHVNPTANMSFTVGHEGLLWRPGYFTHRRHRDTPHMLTPISSSNVDWVYKWRLLLTHAAHMHTKALYVSESCTQ